MVEKKKKKKNTNQKIIKKKTTPVKKADKTIKKTAKKLKQTVNKDKKIICPSKGCPFKGPWNKDKTALVLSIIPGLGQLYKKDWVDFFAVYFGFLVALWCFGVKNILPEEMFWHGFLTVVGWLLVIGTYIWNLIDAYQS